MYVLKAERVQCGCSIIMYVQACALYKPWWAAHLNRSRASTGYMGYVPRGGVFDLSLIRIQVDRST